MLLELAEDLPYIEADELKVKEIIYNLLLNAVKYTPEGGKIGMRVKKIVSEIEVVMGIIEFAAMNKSDSLSGFMKLVPEGVKFQNRSLN